MEQILSEDKENLLILGWRRVVTLIYAKTNIYGGEWLRLRKSCENTKHLAEIQCALKTCS